MTRLLNTQTHYRVTEKMLLTFELVQILREKWQISFYIFIFSSQTNEFLRECQIDSDYRTTSKLTEREKKQAALPILVFGNDLVEKFYSKHYCDKEDGLNRLKEDLLLYDNTKIHAPNKTARAAIFLLHRALRDKVFTVYNLANEVIRFFFTQFVPGR